MAAIEVTVVDDGRKIAARPGDEIVFVLPENATTGYRWHVDDLDDLVLVSDGYRQGAETVGAEPMFGRGGLRELRFEVAGSGTATVSLKLWREWEGDSSVTKRVAVVIDASD